MATTYPRPDSMGGRPWCVELRRRMTGFIPDIVPPFWASRWPDRPGMYNARTTANTAWSLANFPTTNGWPRRETPSSHAYCDGDDYMVVHAGYHAPELLAKVTWTLAIILIEQQPITPPGLEPGYVVELISNRRILTLDQIQKGWRPYYGRSPHTDHAHASISRPGSPLFHYPPRPAA